MATSKIENRRKQSFRNGDRVETYVKTWESVDTYSVDWTDVLASGETISGFTNEANGVTTSGAATNGATTTLTVTGTNGYILYRITTSNSRTLEKLVNFAQSAGENALIKRGYGRYC